MRHWLENTLRGWTGFPVARSSERVVLLAVSSSGRIRALSVLSSLRIACSLSASLEATVVASFKMAIRLDRLPQVAFRSWK